MGRKSKYDWDAVKRDYRLGRYSNRELSRRHGPSESSIRLKAQQEDWTIDLSQRIRDAANRKMLESTIPPDSAGNGYPSFNPVEEAERVRTEGISDEAIVQEASNLAVQLMHEHRRIVGKTRLQVDDILALLDDQIAELKAKGKGKKKEGSDEAEGGPTLMGVTKVLNLNMQTLEKMIKLERVAAGIQDDDAGNTASRFLDELMREKAPN